MTRLAAVFIAIISATPVLVSGRTSHCAALTIDLRTFGFPDFSKVQHTSDYTSLAFLSDDLLLVDINERVWGHSAEPLETDQPPSRFLVIDVNQGKIVKTTEHPVDKSGGSVKATNSDEFVLLDRAGLHVCNASLSCGRPLATQGPVRVLPGGFKLLVGGNGQTEVELLDATTLHVLNRPAPQQLKVDFMRGGILFDGRELISDSATAETGGGDVREMPIQTADGRTLYQVPVTAQYQVRLFANRSGSRFCVLEESYTRWNRVVNSWDIDSGRPHNFARVRVFDTNSGRELFEMKWDPRPSQIVPSLALSPNGHRLALIRHSELEVFDIP